MTAACFYRVEIRGPASKAYEGKGRGDSPDLLELENIL